MGLTWSPEPSKSRGFFPDWSEKRKSESPFCSPERKQTWVFWTVRGSLEEPPRSLVDGLQEAVDFSPKTARKWILPTTSEDEKEPRVPEENCSPCQHFDLSPERPWAENPALQSLQKLQEDKFVLLSCLLGNLLCNIENKGEMRELHQSIKDNQDITGGKKSKIETLPLSSM